MAIQDISNLPISSSFQNLIQRSGSVIGTATGTQIDSLTITASFVESASFATSASFVTSASYAVNSTNAITADSATSATTATSASFATTASFATSASYITTVVQSASYAETASYVETAQTASYIAGANVDGQVDSALSSSHAVNADIAYDANDLVVTVKNTSGGPIAKGDVLHATGVTGENINVELADSTVAANMPGFAIANEAISDNSSGEAIISGKIVGIDTSGLVAGSNVYVNTSGGYTGIKPTGSALIQNIGVVGKVNASEGELIVLGSGRSNDVPNISENYLWVGNSDQVATPTDKDGLTVGTASLALDMPSDTNLSINQITASFASFTSASIGFIESITGSAKIIGDAFVIVNNDTPTERYAGIKVVDSGSVNTTASLQFDGQTNDWFYEYEGDETDHGVLLFGPEYATKGTPIYNTNNRLVKGDGGHHLNDSNITDDGTNVRINSNLEATGSHKLINEAAFPETVLSIKGGLNNIIQVDNDALAAITGVQVVIDGNTKVDGNFEITGNTLFTASLASTASYVAAANIDGTVANATSASFATTASYVAASNVDGTVATATSASHALNADDAISSSYATSASISEFDKNLNAGSGSIQFWQGSKTEYDLISGSASDTVLYFVIGE